ncbi:MAG: hypothetical protein K5873_07115 [Treponema sp.]|nr:hypothetical protein [Treponema sp.]
MKKLKSFILIAALSLLTLPLFSGVLSLRIMPSFALPLDSEVFPAIFIFPLLLRLDYLQVIKITILSPSPL